MGALFSDFRQERKVKPAQVQNELSL
uniref:Uncharacterized protein n=1 Tax=Anguilla anguilla TaxID=7936 RepID=A0A0E9TQW9_ANGAN